MNGVVIKKAQIISEDDRRRIFSILNGQLSVKDIHLLEMKKGDQILGNHKHWYAEVCFVYKGKCHYWLKNKEGETLEVDMDAGDIMFRAPEVTHTCLCSEDCVLIDGAQEPWVHEEWNHVREVLK
jgi:quercetin dioxygenase-like cupin family protein